MGHVRDVLKALGWFKLPRREKRFPPPRDPTHFLQRGCLWCRGSLLWDLWLEEWYCVRCGWREFEALRSAEHGTIGF